MQIISMSKFVSTTFGLISGKHGTAVAVVQPDGTNVLRVYNPPVDKKTPKQLAQRAKFGLVNGALANFREAIRIGYKDRYGFRKASSFMLKNGVTGQYPDLQLDYTKLPIAAGPLPGAPDVTAVADELSTGIKLTWNTIISVLGVAASETDLINVVAYNELTSMCLQELVVAARSLGTATVELPDTWFGSNVHVWVYMSSADGTYNSDSSYAGLIQL